jgi:VWFA-related protein
MRRAGPIAVLALALASAALDGIGPAPAPAQPVQTFRSGTDVVLVDVSVRDGNRPVPGLNAASFVLTDNGVRQQVESVEATSVPVDLTLVLDLSGNPRSPWNDPTPPSKVIARIESEVREIAGSLRNEDRLRVLAIDRNVQLLSPFTAASRMPPLRAFEYEGVPALYDTLAAALLHPVAPARRHVVIARTKGQDSISSIAASDVRAIAEQSDALLHLAMMETALDNDSALSGFQCRMMGYCWPTRRFWVPFGRRLFGPAPIHELTADGIALNTAASASGGDLHKAQMVSVPSLTSIFRRTFENFRSGYVLRYSPRGVPLTGWHTIAVRVPGSRYTIAARRGYGIETPPPQPQPPPIPEMPRTLGEMTAAYARGGYQQVAATLRQEKDPLRLLRAFDGAGNPWPAAPKREAAFALELAEPGVFSTNAAARKQTYELLGRFVRYVRPSLEPDMFERYWHFALLTLLEGTLRPAASASFVDAALARFPDEPRFVLSRAIVSEQRWAGVGPGLPEGSPLDFNTVRANYEKAIALPEVAVEARIRLGEVLRRAGHHQAALDHLTRAAAGSVADPHLRYLRSLLLGNTLAALGRHADAAAAYRSALEVIPAQSARVALMNALLMQGDRAGAEALSQTIQTLDQTSDPWWMYWQGQYRLHGLAMARIRELSR